MSAGLEWIVRAENQADCNQIHAINVAAFGRADEAEIVERFRKSSRFLPELSLVAQRGAEIAGHALFSAAIVEAEAGNYDCMTLGPIAVLPEFQRQGAGAALIGEGLKLAARDGCPMVALVGHPTYYPRFGFVRASTYGVSCNLDVSDEAFMLYPILPASIRPGRLVFASEFFG